jgi:hypothetical protein
LTNKVVLDNTFIIESNKCYYETILKRLEIFNDAVDLHSMVDCLHPPILKQEYILSINKCFDYLINSTQNALTQAHKAYIQKEKDVFLTTTSQTLLDLLLDFDKKSTMVLYNIPVKSGSLLGQIVAGAAEGFLTPNRAIVGAIKSFTGGGTNKEEVIAEDWDKTRTQVLEEIDALWEKYCELLDTIAENTSIEFDIDEEALEKQMAEEENPIMAILEKYLGTDESCFYFYDNIPPTKKNNAKSSYVKLDADEKIVCLYDSTVFGGAKEGICFTTKAIYWKAFMEDGEFVDYSDIKSCTIDDDDMLSINDMVVESSPMGQEIKQALDEISAYVATTYR